MNWDVVEAKVLNHLAASLLAHLLDGRINARQGAA
jgi:hypothetical protein